MILRDLATEIFLVETWGIMKNVASFVSAIINVIFLHGCQTLVNDISLCHP